MVKSHRELGPYKLGKILGKGQTSIVRIGVNKKTKEKVALKILYKKQMSNAEKLKRTVETEINALQKLRHPNVLCLHSVDWNAKYPHKDGTSEDAVVIALELSPNGELFDYLMHTGSFSEVVSRTYFHQLIGGLEECHSKGVVHRDLKPDNLLLNSAFVLKIADFGYSRLNEKQMYTYVGTRGYMAPEVVEIGSSYTKACDIWSSAVIAFLMYAGFPPYMQPKRTDWWFDKLYVGNYNKFWMAHEQQMKFAPAFKDLINRMLCKDHTKRITIEGIKAHAWYKGETLSQKELVAELQRRKPRVDEGKRMEMLEEKNRSSSIEPSGSHRAAPEFARPGLGRQGSISNLLDEEEELDIDFKSLPEAEPFAKQEVNCFNIIKSPLDPQMALYRVAQCANSGGRWELDDEELAVEVKFGSTEFNAEIYSDPEVKDGSVIALRKLSGGFAEFRKQFRALEAVLLKGDDDEE